jgi:hypothetical protein
MPTGDLPTSYVTPLPLRERGKYRWRIAFATHLGSG